MSEIINNEKYQMIKILGKGAYGVVYQLAKNNKFYAYKKISLIDLSKEEIN